jgi:hypothetical protein
MNRPKRGLKNCNCGKAIARIGPKVPMRYAARCSTLQQQETRTSKKWPFQYFHTLNWQIDWSALPYSVVSVHSSFNERLWICETFFAFKYFLSAISSRESAALTSMTWHRPSFVCGSHVPGSNTQCKLCNSTITRFDARIRVLYIRDDPVECGYSALKHIRI